MELSVLCALISIAPVGLAASLLALQVYYVIRYGKSTGSIAGAPVIVALLALAAYNNVQFEGGGLKLNVSGRICDVDYSEPTKTVSKLYKCVDRQNLSVMIFSTDAREPDRTSLRAFLRQQGIDADTASDDMKDVDPRPSGTNRVIYDHCGEKFVRDGSLYRLLEPNLPTVSIDALPRNSVMKGRSIQILMY